MPVFILLAVASGITAAVIYAAGGRGARVAVAVFVAAAIVFGVAGAAGAAPVRPQHEGAACVFGGIGVGLSWVGVGATAVTAEAHAGVLTALAGTQAAAATGAWASSCPDTAAALFGVTNRWHYRRNGCIFATVPYRSRAWARTPVGWCWRDVPNVRALRRLIGPKVGQLAAVAYRADVGGDRYP